MSKATPIPAPLSRSAEIVMVVSGVLCLLNAATTFLVSLAAAGGSLHSLSLDTTFLVSFQAGLGGAMLTMPSRLRQGREELLAKPRASSEMDDPGQVEVRPPPSDLVVISILWGGLSIISWPMLFAPAAIVCGILAAAKGHLKGLIGVVLGLFGLAGFALLIIFLADK
ncbi:MAG TPA: hypothetical protein VH643_33960 [Gemmataceae bacterium]|jgi:hypothetical protein